MVIGVQVRKKIASVINEESVIICGNRGYEIAFDFDGEWDNHLVKTARFTWNGQYEDVVFEGDVCPVPVLYKAIAVFVGVTAGDIRTTTNAKVKAKPSAFCDSGVPASPTDDVYCQIMEKVDESVSVSQSVREDADNGVFNGEDGYTPEKGVDYWTEEDKQEIINEIPGGVVDQSFDQSSENAQSGKAVNEAISGIKSQIEYNVGLEIDEVKGWCGNNTQLGHSALETANIAKETAETAYAIAQRADVYSGDTLTNRIDTLEAQVGNIDAVLDELHNYAQSLTGGVA